MKKMFLISGLFEYMFHYVIETIFVNPQVFKDGKKLRKGKQNSKKGSNKYGLIQNFVMFL